MPFLFISLAEDGKRGYKGVVDAFVKILTKEGPFAFWTGLVPYYFRCAPHAMIILMVSESLTKMYKEAFMTR